MPHVSVSRGSSYEPLRRLFTEHGFPDLGPQSRALALDVHRVTQAVDEALHGVTGLPHARLLALALCWHDHWDESHAICQAHEGDKDIDFVHMVLHRREPDAPNCRYWIAQAGWHPVYEALPKVAKKIGHADLAPTGRWNPELFLERCLLATASDHQALIALQAAELLALRDRLLPCQG